MPFNLFTYGSLMLPEVLEKVCGRTYDSAAAKLIGWSRYCVVGETYPGIIPSSRDSVSGVLWLGITPVELALLDKFEGDEYQRISVMVRDQINKPYSAQVYAWREQGGLTRQAWDLEQFRAEGVKAFSEKFL
jgi:gamma-glutamylcyclotransferase (GGCT)/AIG2-like uncharacterized protein YtfP